MYVPWQAVHLEHDKRRQPTGQPGQLVACRTTRHQLFAACVDGLSRCRTGAFEPIIRMKNDTMEKKILRRGAMVRGCVVRPGTGGSDVMKPPKEESRCGLCGCCVLDSWRPRQWTSGSRLPSSTARPHGVDPAWLTIANRADFPFYPFPMPLVVLRFDVSAYVIMQPTDLRRRGGGKATCRHYLPTTAAVIPEPRGSGLRHCLTRMIAPFDGDPMPSPFAF